MAATSVTIELPCSARIVVQSFANAAYPQRVTVEPKGMAAKVLQGQGLHDTPIGSFEFKTPPGDEDSFPVTVSVAHSRDGGQTWQPSAVAWMNCLVKGYGLATVVSEDAGDDTWDDATTYFNWIQPPE